MSVVRIKILVSFMQKGFRYLYPLLCYYHVTSWALVNHMALVSVFFWMTGLPDINSYFCNAFAFFCS